MRHRRAVVRLVMVMLVFVAFLFVFVFPIRTLFAQREDTGVVREQLELLRGQNAQLEEEAERLQSDAEVERIAREQYNLVRPGETPYTVVEEPPPTTAASESPTTPETP
ncbi:MAG: FtsB family cell division protein [Acidimicrobiia bacterium]